MYNQQKMIPYSIMANILQKEEFVKINDVSDSIIFDEIRYERQFFYGYFGNQCGHQKLRYVACFSTKYFRY